VVDPPAPGEPERPHINRTRGGNAHGKWKTCKVCDRRVEYIDAKTQKVSRDPHYTGFMAVNWEKARSLWIPPPGYKPPERIQVADALATFSDTCGKLIADSGCKRSVAGASWHKATQEWLAEQGLKPIEEQCTDTFRFGDGRTVAATRSWRYPCGIRGYNGILSVAEVETTARLC
jgi:hypothetical protein